jgi:hypothetical protein
MVATPWRLPKAEERAGPQARMSALRARVVCRRRFGNSTIIDGPSRRTSLASLNHSLVVIFDVPVLDGAAGT